MFSAAFQISTMTSSRERDERGRSETKTGPYELPETEQKHRREEREGRKERQQQNNAAENQSTDENLSAPPRLCVEVNRANHANQPEGL